MYVKGYMQGQGCVRIGANTLQCSDQPPTWGTVRCRFAHRRKIALLRRGVPQGRCCYSDEAVLLGH